MTIGEELRTVQKSEELRANEKLYGWFNKHHNELVGCAATGSSVLEYSDVETYNFFLKLENESLFLFRKFLEREELEVGINYTNKTITISWEN